MQEILRLHAKKYKISFPVKKKHPCCQECPDYNTFRFNINASTSQRNAPYFVIFSN